MMKIMTKMTKPYECNFRSLNDIIKVNIPITNNYGPELELEDNSRLIFGDTKDFINILNNRKDIINERENTINMDILDKYIEKSDEVGMGKYKNIPIIKASEYNFDGIYLLRIYF